MPKDYQISQYDQPINVDGWLELPDGHAHRHRARPPRGGHRQVDPHRRRAAGASTAASTSLVDYNRAGVPLARDREPSPTSARPRRPGPYVSELRAILVATGASDAKMEEGSMRVDANVSVRPRRRRARSARAARSRTSTRVRSLGRAIEYEARRQIDAARGGRAVRQETRHWDEDDGRTHTLRTKEDADDYRYFPEPDLVPLAPDAEWIDRGPRRACPLLPAERRAAPGRRPRASAPTDAGGGGRRRARPGRPRPRRHRRRRRPGPGARARRAQPGRRGRRPAVRPRPLAALTTLEVGGHAHRHAGQGGAGRARGRRRRRRPGRHRRRQGLRGDGRPTPWRRPSTQAIAAEPAPRGTSTSAARTRSLGALVGAVMKATKGQADGKAVTALLQERRSQA